MAKETIPYEKYTHKQLVEACEACEAGCVKGLEGLKLSDSDIVLALRMDYPGSPNIRILKEAGWSRQRVIEAEKAYGVDSESLELLIKEYDLL